MLRVIICLVAALLVAETLSTASAQTPAPAATTTPAAAKPSRIKLTVERLKEMRAKWVQNKPKLKACRAEMKSKGLTGDDRWFYMADCMDKT
jgi:tRNA(Ile2) C34 agmatinyltransferase TiaS